MITPEIYTLQQYVNIANNFDVERLKPFENSTLLFLKQYLSEELLEMIIGFVGATADSDEEKMYKKFLAVFLPKTLHSYIDQGEVVISELGITRSENENTKTAYSGQIVRLRNSLFDQTMDALDAFISAIENSTIPLISTPWSESSAKKNRDELFIKTATEFNAIEILSRPQLTFIQLIPRMLEIQLVDLPKTFPQSVLDEFANPTNPDFTIPLQLVKSAIAKLAIAESIQRNLVSLTLGGLVANSVRSNSENVEESVPSSLESASSYYRKMIDAGLRQLELAKRLLTPDYISENSYIPKRFIA